MKRTLRQAFEIIRSCKQAEYVVPRYASKDRPWPGTDKLILIHGSCNDRVHIYNAVAIRQGCISFICIGPKRFDLKDFASCRMECKTGLGLNDWITESLANLLASGAVHMRPLRKGDLVEADAFLVHDGVVKRGFKKHYDDLRRRTFDSWCRAIAPYVSMPAISLAKTEDLGLNGFTKRRSRPGKRSHPVLSSPHLVEDAAPMAMVLDHGEKGLRAWTDVRRERPWLAQQALSDPVLLAAMMDGREIGGMIERRLGVDRHRRKIMENWIRAVSRVSIKSIPGMDHPVIGDYAGIHSVGLGSCVPQAARAIGWLPQGLMPINGSNQEAFPARCVFIDHVFERIYGDLYCCSNRKHPKGDLHNGGTHPAFGYDWRLRPHAYAVENMARLTSGGGLALHRVPYDRGHVDDVIGLAEDIHLARRWAVAQVVAPRMARAAHRAWALVGECSDDPSMKAVICRLGRHAGRGQLDGLYAKEWFAVAAALLCNRETTGLLPLFADIALPRSIKRLRRLSAAHHRILASRGVLLPSNFEDGWPPLFRNDVLRLTDFPSLNAVCLTDCEALTREGKSMNHCVGSFAQICGDGMQHILSLRTDRGETLSTMQIALTQRNVSGGGIDNAFALVQHRARRNAVPENLALAFAGRLMAILSSDDQAGIELNDEALKPRLSRQSAMYTDHDPWSDDALESEAEVMALFGDPIALTPHMDAIASSLLRAPLPWVRNAHMRHPSR